MIGSEETAKEEVKAFCLTLLSVQNTMKLHAFNLIISHNSILDSIHIQTHKWNKTLFSE